MFFFLVLNRLFKWKSITCIGDWFNLHSSPLRCRLFSHFLSDVTFSIELFISPILYDEPPKKNDIVILFLLTFQLIFLFIIELDETTTTRFLEYIWKTIVYVLLYCLNGFVHILVVNAWRNLMPIMCIHRISEMRTHIHNKTTRLIAFDSLFFIRDETFIICVIAAF
jgi:hypothetical protein